MRSPAPRRAEIGNNPESSVLPSTDVMKLSNYAGINVGLIGRPANKGMAAVARRRLKRKRSGLADICSLGVRRVVGGGAAWRVW